MRWTGSQPPFTGKLPPVSNPGQRVMMQGNEAIALGAISAGLKFYSFYPMTPATSVGITLAKWAAKMGLVVEQAEDEIAAINMVIEASMAGSRAMTSSSSPGISLKQEGIYFLAALELPAVIVNMSRGGPGLGNIAPAQSDYFQDNEGGQQGKRQGDQYHQRSPETAQQKVKDDQHENGALSQRPGDRGQRTW